MCQVLSSLLKVDEKFLDHALFLHELLRPVPNSGWAGTAIRFHAEGNAKLLHGQQTADLVVVADAGTRGR